MNNCECNNNYSNENEFFESFAKNDNELKKCNACPYLNFSDGIAICTKFQKVDGWDSLYGK